MRNWTLAVALLIPVAACTQPGDRPASNRQADEEAIRQIMKDAGAAHRAGDAERWAGLFTSDAVYMPQNDTSITGRDALLALARARFERYVSTVTIEPLEIQVADDWAYARTALSGAFTPKDGGAPIELDAKEIAIFERQPDGSWRVARLIGNSNRP